MLPRDMLNKSRLPEMRDPVGLGVKFWRILTFFNDKYICSKFFMGVDMLPREFLKSRLPEMRDPAGLGIKFWRILTFFNDKYICSKFFI